MMLLAPTTRFSASAEVGHCGAEQIKSNFCPYFQSNRCSSVSEQHARHPKSSYALMQAPSRRTDAKLVEVRVFTARFLPPATPSRLATSCILGPGKAKCGWWEGARRLITGAVIKDNPRDHCSQLQACARQPSIPGLNTTLLDRLYSLLRTTQCYVEVRSVLRPQTFNIRHC
jgi:hypothetical protein